MSDSLTLVVDEQPQTEIVALKHDLSRAVERETELLNTPAPTGPAGWNREQLQILKDSFFKGCSDQEFQFCLEFCKATGLNPFLKQVHFPKRWDAKLQREVVTPVVGIDGMRSRALSTGEYEGQTKSEWCGQDGVWVDVWLKDDEFPYAARVGIYRRNFKEPTYAVARFSEYVQTMRNKTTGKTVPVTMWQKMPTNQLAKCAESLALRKAFPELLTGIYSSDEMAQADNETK